MDYFTTPAPIPLSYGIQDLLRRGGPEFDPWVGAEAALLETRLPIPLSAEAFSSEGYFRLAGHRRSVCFSPPTQEPIRNVFCIKGMEPLAPDFCAQLDKLASQRAAFSDPTLNCLENFILHEDKLPGCLLLSEIETEAVAAANIQFAFEKDGLGIPRLPCPVICVRLPDTILETALRAIADRTSRLLWKKVELLASGGVGAYVYWYPSLPLRARNFSAKPQQAAALGEKWIALAARLLRSGFLPTSAHSRGRGHCCNNCNAVIDGGFVDLTSVVPIEEIHLRQDVYIALQVTILRIASTIAHILGLDKPGVADSEYAAHIIRHTVRTGLAQACGKDVHPILVEFFAATESLASATQFSERA